MVAVVTIGLNFNLIAPTLIKLAPVTVVIFWSKGSYPFPCRCCCSLHRFDTQGAGSTDFLTFLNLSNNKLDGENDKHAKISTPFLNEHSSTRLFQVSLITFKLKWIRSFLGKKSRSRRFISDEHLFQRSLSITPCSVFISLKSNPLSAILGKHVYAGFWGSTPSSPGFWEMIEL